MTFPALLNIAVLLLMAVVAELAFVIYFLGWLAAETAKQNRIVRTRILNEVR